MHRSYGVFELAEGMDLGYFEGEHVVGKFYVAALNVWSADEEPEAEFDPMTDEVTAGPFDSKEEAERYAAEAEEEA